MRSRTALSALVALAALSCSRGPQRDIVLITIDTLRADRLGLYGYERATTPEIDRR